MVWFCQHCGFGPHNDELHAACLECGKPRTSGDHEPAQSPHTYQYYQNVDSADIHHPYPTEVDAITRNHPIEESFFT
ncbi:hypothetical protein HOY82DRAFT_477289 [Tuber indicum]|nr:hypothetical protein HOY82DRAFT_477289 [Tuber indicum]